MNNPMMISTLPPRSAAHDRCSTEAGTLLRFSEFDAAPPPRLRADLSLHERVLYLSVMALFFVLVVSFGTMIV